MQVDMILDALKNLARIDKSDLLGFCMKIPESCRDAIRRTEETEIPKEVKVSKQITIKYGKPRNIIVTGMGGSAIGGEILQDWLRDRLTVPVEICRDYVLPAYADRSTLVIAVSFSGETEETLSAFVDAIGRRCMVITISSGGRLLSASKGMKLPHVVIPNGRPPRAAIPHLFFPLPILLEKMDVIAGLDRELNETIQVVESVGKENSPLIATRENPSKTLALELRESIPVVYGFRQFRAIAHRLKTQFNENSKQFSTYNVFPELNHNEIVAWESPEIATKGFAVVLIRDPDEPLEIKHRIEIIKRFAAQRAQKVLEIPANGKQRLAKMFSVMLKGDFASVYLAILRGLDPTPVKTIDETKAELSRKSDMLQKLDREILKLTN